MYIHWRARDNRSKWETGEGGGRGRGTKTRTVFPSWLISTRFRIRTRRRFVRATWILVWTGNRLLSQFSISLVQLVRLAPPPPLPPRRLITTKRRFPFPPTQENFAPPSLPPSRLRLFNPAPIFLFDRSISRAASRETAESGNQRFWSAVSVSDKNLLHPEMGEGIGLPATITICKSLQDRSEVCGVRDYVGDNVVQRGGREKEGRGIEKKGKQEIYGNRS